MLCHTPRIRLCAGNPFLLETLLSRRGARQVHQRCKCPLYVPERKLGIMRCLDWPGAAHASFPRACIASQRMPRRLDAGLAAAGNAGSPERPCGTVQARLQESSTHIVILSLQGLCSMPACCTGPMGVRSRAQTSTSRSSSPPTRRRRLCTSPAGASWVRGWQHGDLSSHSLTQQPAAYARRAAMVLRPRALVERGREQCSLVHACTIRRALM